MPLRNIFCTCIEPIIDTECDCGLCHGCDRYPISLGQEEMEFLEGLVNSLLRFHKNIGDDKTPFITLVGKIDDKLQGVIDETYGEETG